VHIAAPSKKKLHFVVHDLEPGYDTYTEKPGYSWDADVAFAMSIRANMPQREKHCCIPRLGAGHQGCGSAVCELRCGDRRRDGFGTSMA